VGNPCKRCIGPTRTQLPRHLCLRIRLVGEGVFSKCLPPFLIRRETALIGVVGAEPSYKSKLVWGSLERGFAAKIALLTHERGGLTLQVHCRDFDATSQNQTQLFWKETTGWNCIYSTTYSLEMPNIDLRQYIDECASFLLKGAAEKVDYLGQIFQMAQLHQRVSYLPAAEFKRPFSLSAQETTIRLALRLWAANRLLMKGWEICGHERLGMKTVDRMESPLYGSVPAPRVLQNQLDYLLESEIVETERRLLKNLQKLIKASDRISWVATFLAIAIVLHVMKRDAWRLLYWIHHKEQVRYFKYLPNVLLMNLRSTPDDTLSSLMHW